MPQPNKKRGRRVDGKKRKLENGADDDPELAESSTKRRKSTVDGSGAEDDYIALHDGGVEEAYPSADNAFFGVLEDQEQEYFKHADDMLESNAFGDPEERTLFLANVYKEAEGKELKIAQSQSCSRLMERLIQLSSASQLKTLFDKFGGKYVYYHLRH